jgi:ribosomal protein L29
MKCNNQYKKFTIKSLLNSLEEIMARNPEITLDSEVIISDINMGAFKQEVKIYPTHDYKDGQMKVGIYLNPYEKDELIDTVEEVKTEQVSEQVKKETEQVNPHNAQVIQQITQDLAQVNQPQPQEEPQPIKQDMSLAWLQKYTRR